ncbi:NAD(P)H-hydrate dehydratase [Shewanella livingstonensis]|uniref:ADP-dependent (S)-NAD(P)H-hydrate dehydratase n=1 Tax=Shewanella livingstonensis TaxID=150120 RepID=A0A3G8LWG9_9GAMM|nr:NAD(P)H-hydrate dehydratase [Shewanella livingstonensis]AZG73505.1 NAD(P)H-hydrate dehydratase [Shewanella livingstonensis]
MQTLIHDYIKAILPPRPNDSHKMTFGNVLNIAGSINYRGAAYLSSISALRVGAGYVTLASSPIVCDSVSALTPNVVTLPLLISPTEKDHILTQPTDLLLKQLPSTNMQSMDVQTIDAKAVLQLRDKLTQASVISIGSGLSLGQSTDQLSVNAIHNSLDNKNHSNNHLNSLIVPEGNRGFFYALLREIQTNTNPVIFDADALNFISGLSHASGTMQTPIILPKNSIITPHPKELSRLLNVDVSKIQAQRVYYANIAAKQYKTVVVLKGQHTVISDGERVFINPTGNSALAKAGTGDVLTGMIAGFCAQGASPINAACLGVYLHGLAGDIAAKDLSQYSVLASDLLNYIPQAILKVLTL